MTLEPDAFVGCIMRIKAKNRWRIMLAVRLHDEKSTGRNWSNFTQITDSRRCYAKMPIDMVSIVSVRSAGSANIMIEDLFTLTLTREGDTTTIMQAIRDGFLPAILDRCLESEGLLNGRRKST